MRVILNIFVIYCDFVVYECLDEFDLIWFFDCYCNVNLLVVFDLYELMLFGVGW